MLNNLINFRNFRFIFCEFYFIFYNDFFTANNMKNKIKIINRIIYFRRQIKYFLFKLNKNLVKWKIMVKFNKKKSKKV